MSRTPVLATDGYHACQNCGRVWEADELLEIADLSARVAAGEPVPSGECPACGALCQPTDEKPPDFPHAEYRKAYAERQRVGHEYVVACPHCGSDSIWLTAFVGDCHIPVGDDGWSFLEGPCHTSEEQFACGRCEQAVEARYVTGSVWDA